MAVSVLQTVFGTDSAANGLTETVTLTVTAGSSIHVGATIDSLTTFASIASVPVMTWTLRDDVNDTGNNQRLAHWTADGAASGSLVITVTNTILTDFRACWASEIGGTNGYDAAASAAHAAQYQATPGTGTDAVSSGNTSTLSVQPACISAFCLNTAGNALPSFGTGFTDTGSGIAFGFGTNLVRAEYKRVTATTALAGTFTTASNTGHLTVAAVFKESGGGGGTTLTPAEASIVITGQTPTLLKALAPALASVVITGNVPSLVLRIAPALASVVITGQTPTVAQAVILNPALASVVITGNTPAIVTTLSPSLGSVVITGNTPAIALILAPALASVVITGNTPTLTKGIGPALASIVITGNTPSISLTLAASIGQVVITGNTPTISNTGGTQLFPAEGQVIITGNTPSISWRFTVPSEGQVVITGYVPQVRQFDPLATTADRHSMLSARHVRKRLIRKGR